MMPSKDEWIKALNDRHGEDLQNNPSNMQTLLERQANLIQALEEGGWHRRDATAESVLLGLGFSHEDLTRQTEEFSGGWQMRIALAKALMQNPDILLLDEPTNYLDIEARTWLEQFLVNYKGAFLLVSHDRYFLDVTINEVYELFGGDLKRYPGNFTHYEKVREVELKTLIAAYEQQQQVKVRVWEHKQMTVYTGFIRKLNEHERYVQLDSGKRIAVDSICAMTIDG